MIEYKKIFKFRNQLNYIIFMYNNCENDTIDYYM